MRIGLAAKGAGMISPRMATTLCFVTTDAVIPQPALDDLLRRVVARTFNSVTVDGQQSTNDMVLCLANGASGVAVTGPSLTVFEQALEAAMLSLAVALVGDGEGSTRTVRLTVSGAWDDGEAAAVARSVGDSPLVKAAFFGGDPNWGRIVQAAGQIVGSTDGARFRVEVAYGDVEVVRDGEPVELGRGSPSRPLDPHGRARDRPLSDLASRRWNLDHLLQRPEPRVRVRQLREHDLTRWGP